MISTSRSQNRFNQFSESVDLPILDSDYDCLFKIGDSPVLYIPQIAQIQTPSSYGLSFSNMEDLGFVLPQNLSFDTLSVSFWDDNSENNPVRNVKHHLASLYQRQFTKYGTLRVGFNDLTVKLRLGKLRDSVDLENSNSSARLRYALNLNFCSVSNPGFGSFVANGKSLKLINLVLKFENYNFFSKPKGNGEGDDDGWDGNKGFNFESSYLRPTEGIAIKTYGIDENRTVETSSTPYDSSLKGVKSFPNSTRNLSLDRTGK